VPFRSPEQRRAMYAAASGHGKIGISQTAAKRFIAHSTGKRVHRLRKEVGKRLMQQ